MSALTSNFTSVSQTLEKDIRAYLTSKLSPYGNKLSKMEKKYVDDIKSDGFTVIQNYWNRNEAIRMKELLEKYLKVGKSKNFPSGAYMRFWDNRAHDTGVRRIYHIDREIPELAKVRFDPFIFKIVNSYYRYPFYSGILAFQHNTKTNYDTREYHVDDFNQEFKAFVYLDDVDEGNGPFTYIRGSHVSHFVRLKKQLLGNTKGSSTSFFEEDLGELIKNEVKLVGKAGTLILADVRGFHRGSPQKKGSRSVLVNYMYLYPGDKELDMKI